MSTEMKNPMEAPAEIRWRDVRAAALADPASTSTGRAVRRLAHRSLRAAPASPGRFRISFALAASVPAVVAVVVAALRASDPGMPASQPASQVAMAAPAVAAPAEPALAPLPAPDAASVEAPVVRAAAVRSAQRSAASVVPEAPVHVELAKDGDSVRLSWAEVGRSTGYSVSRCWLGQGIEACQDLGAVTAASFTDSETANPFGLTVYRVVPLGGDVARQQG